MIERLRLDVYEYHHKLSFLEMSLTRDKFTLVDLRRRLRIWLGLASSPVAYASGTLLSPFPFQDFADKYGEVATSNVIADLEKLWAQAGQYLTPGGLPVGYSPLNYLPARIRVNTSSLSALGEGIAGFYLEYIAGFSALARPVLVSPDFIFETQANELALVEIKTTGQPQQHIRTPIIQASIGLLDVLVKNRLISGSRRYVGVAVGVVIRDLTANELLCEIHSLTLEEP